MELPPKGSLNGISFISLLLDVTESRLTGMIRMESGSVIKVVYLQQGNIAFASSNEKTDRLTEVLKRAGKLTPEQIEHAQARLKPNVSLGKTLVELGYINPKDLLWGARMQVEGVLHQLLFWKEGNFQVIEGPLPREIVSLNMPVVQIIYDGIMKTQDRNWVLQHIESPQAVFALSPEFHEKNAQYKLPALEVVSRVNAKRTLEEIAIATGMDAFEVCKTAAALHILKLLQKTESEPGITLPAEVPKTNAATEAIEMQEEPFGHQFSLGQVLQIPTVEELQRQPVSTRRVDEEPPSEPTLMFPPAVEEEIQQPALILPADDKEEDEPKPTLIIAPAFENEKTGPGLLTPPVFEEETPEPTMMIQRPQNTPSIIDVPPDPASSAPTVFTEKPIFFEEDEQETEDVAPVEPLTPTMPSMTVEEEEEPEEPTVQFTDAPVRRMDPYTVPLQSMAAASAKKTHSMDRAVNWKKIALLTGVLAIATLGVLYFLRSMPASPGPAKAREEQKPADPTPAPAVQEPATQEPAKTGPNATNTVDPNKPIESKPVEPKPAEPKRAEPKPAPKAGTPSPSSPLGLVQAGKLPEAAAAWKKSLSSQKSRYTIQLEIACQQRTVDEAFELISTDSELAIVPLNYKGQSCYRVLHGVYATTAQAQAARAKLPSIFLNQRSPAAVIPVAKALK